jgi:hypothetical protein
MQDGGAVSANKASPTDTAETPVPSMEAGPPPTTLSPASEGKGSPASSSLPKHRSRRPLIPKANPASGRRA